jgi:hypothetical protein
MAITQTQISGVLRVAIAWTSDSSGNASATTDPISGTLCKVEFVPGTSGNAPTTAYDITLTDVGGVDVLAGQGANLTLSPTSVVPGVPFTDGTTTSTAPCVVSDALALAVSNAGNTKSGQVILYVR